MKVGINRYLKVNYRASKSHLDSIPRIRLLSIKTAILNRMLGLKPIKGVSLKQFFRLIPTKKIKIQKYEKVFIYWD